VSNGGHTRKREKEKILGREWVEEEIRCWWALNCVMIFGGYKTNTV
jgi:hypothetical protein